MADLKNQNTFQQTEWDSELKTLRSKVGPPTVLNHSLLIPGQCMNIAVVTVT